MPVHWHTSNYWAVVVEGQSKHWLPGGSDKQAHGDSCETDSSTIFIVMDKKLDLTPVK